MNLLLLLSAVALTAPTTAPAVGPTVRVELVDRDVPTNRKWPTGQMHSAESYLEPAFAFTQVPWRYTGTGVRADRGNPFLLRATADVVLPAGRLRLLLRARSAARLTIDGKLVGELPFAAPIMDGVGPVRNDALSLGLTRQVGAGDHEKVVEFTASGKPQTVVFELIVGGLLNKEPLRPELGESLVAYARAGRDDFRLLAPSVVVPLTDADFDRYVVTRQAAIESLEATRRRAAFTSHADYWAKRRALAIDWLRAHPAPPIPPHTPTLPAHNAIDHFLNAKLAPALAAAKNDTGTVRFHRDVQPILAVKCVSCHGATKPRGGLRLDDRRAALAGGDSGEPMARELLRRVTSHEASIVMPPKGEKLSAKELEKVTTWVREGARWPEEAPVAALTSSTTDEEFLRRAYLDVVGTVPTVTEARAFLADRTINKRAKLLDTLLADPRWADAWTPYWMDVLAENANIVNPTLNNTGPFRFWIHDVLRDNKPWDVAVTELVLMEGSRLGGGPGGFGLAAQNDAPMAAKAGILASAFLAVEMKCARCHDAPYHPVTQVDLFGLAALLDRKPVAVPATSSVPLDKFAGRKPLVTVALEPGAKVKPAWPLGRLLRPEHSPPLQPGRDADSRVRLAALITAPANERFAEVMVNRVWRRYFGRGLVEPPHDWDAAKPSHPELLKWLAREFVRSGYDLKHVARLVLTSHAYQRQSSADGDLVRLFAAPAKRRLDPERLADSVFDAFGRAYDTEIICFDLDGGRPARQGVNFGVPRRAWQFPYLSNDRDRPTLSLPKAQAVTDLMAAFGWDGNRQFAVSDRAAEPSVLQPALLTNGTAGRWLARLSEDTALTRLCLEAKSVEELVETLCLHTWTRRPTASERVAFIHLLTPGFAGRVVLTSPAVRVKPRQPYATWSNHHTDEAVVVKQDEATAARRGPAPTARLTPAWRERAEDVLWAMLNSPELVYVP